MHLVQLDRWNELESPLHRLDPRSKILAVLGLVLFLVLSSQGLALKLPAAGAFLVAMILFSRVPLGYCLRHASLVLPFSLMAVGAALLGKWVWAAEFSGRMSTVAAVGIVGKSYLSALAVLLLAATTRLSDLLYALERFRVPGAFLMIVHFLYRYLFVLSEEAQHMRYAHRSRGVGRGWPLRWQAAAAAIAVLFVRSYARAERIHRAMLARGFDGVLPTRHRFQWQARDFLFLGLTAAYLAAVQVAMRHLL